MSSRPSRGFTLVEILVVVAIIVILMAILLPVSMSAIAKARNASLAVEIRELKVAIEEYKNKHGDYPPSMDWDPNYGANFAAQAGKWYSGGAPTPYAYSSVCEKHLQRCYRDMTPAERNKFYAFIAPILDQDEALVFWLSMVANDPRAPFKNFAYNSSNNNIYYAGGNTTTALVMADFPGTYTRHVHHEFDQRRLADSDNDGIPGFVAPYCRETTYMYFDSRTYGFTQNPAYAARQVAQPYSDYAAYSVGHPKFYNPNTYQIVCSGQDGNYGQLVTAFPTGNFGAFDWQFTKFFRPDPPNNVHTNIEDHDNLTDFSEGKMSDMRQ